MYIVINQGHPFLKNAYLEKLRAVMVNLGLDYQYWIWPRGQPAPADPRVKVLLSTAYRGWGRSLLAAIGYLHWAVVVFLAVLAKRKEGHVYLCSRFDTALPVAIASYFTTTRFAFLDRDTFSKSYNWPKSVRIILEHLERIIIRRAELHVVPGWSRVDAVTSKVRVIQNTPEQHILSQARQSRQFADVSNRQERLKICYSGLISDTRGAKWVLDVISRLHSLGTSFEVHVAGRLVGDASQKLLQHESVIHHGELSNADALALTHSTDIVLAFYDPSIEINRLAEPNKWFDCAALEVPFITNDGLNTAAPFVEHGACLTVPYGDTDALVALLFALSQDRRELGRISSALRGLNFLPWDVGMSEVLRELSNTLPTR